MPYSYSYSHTLILQRSAMTSLDKPLLKKSSSPSRSSIRSNKNNSVKNSHHNHHNFTKNITDIGSVALLGRVNVGKSSLFNHLTKSKKAIVSKQPGCTRDRIYGTFIEKSYQITLIDCGGYDQIPDQLNYDLLTNNLNQNNSTSNAYELFLQQSIFAFLQSDLAILICDGKFGEHFFDFKLLQMIKKHHKPFIIALSKIDNDHLARCAKWDFTKLIHHQKELGMFSSTTGLGIDNLKQLMITNLLKINNCLSIEKPKKPSNVDNVNYNDLNIIKNNHDKPKPKIALVGRPNSGKSSIFNRMLKQYRSTVCEVSGTTRDSIHCDWTYQQNVYTVIDTAGIRRRTKIDDPLEKTSVSISLKNIQDTLLCIVIIDATQNITDQDAKLIKWAIKHNKPLIIAINKWDLIENKNSKSCDQYEKKLRSHHLANLSYIPIVFVSALKNQRIDKLYSLSKKILEMSSTRIPTPKLNNTLIEITAKKPPTLVKTYQKRMKFYYITQINTNPVTFLINTNYHKKHLHHNYLNYLIKMFQKKLGLKYVPISMIFKDKVSITKQKIINVKS